MDENFGNILLNIDQVSKLTGVRKSTIRYWEKCFVEFLKPNRTESNRREYSLKEIDRIKEIKKLLDEEHLTSTGVKIRLGQIFLKES
jgi:DNA-binding transcriptional MerR regulator